MTLAPSKTNETQFFWSHSSLKPAVSKQLSRASSISSTLWLSSSTSYRNTNSGLAPSTTEAFKLTIMADLWLRDVASSLRTDNLLEDDNTVNYYVFHYFCITLFWEQTSPCWHHLLPEAQWDCHGQCKVGSFFSQYSMLFWIQFLKQRPNFQIILENFTKFIF